MILKSLQASMALFIGIICMSQQIVAIHTTSNSVSQATHECPFCTEQKDGMISMHEAFHCNCSENPEHSACRACLAGHIRASFERQAEDQHIPTEVMRQRQIPCPFCRGTIFVEDVANRYAIEGDFSEARANELREQAANNFIIPDDFELLAGRNPLLQAQALAQYSGSQNLPQQPHAIASRLPLPPHNFLQQAQDFDLSTANPDEQALLWALYQRNAAQLPAPRVIASFAVQTQTVDECPLQIMDNGSWYTPNDTLRQNIEQNLQGNSATARLRLAGDPSLRLLVKQRTTDDGQVVIHVQLVRQQGTRYAIVKQQGHALETAFPLHQPLQETTRRYVENISTFLTNQ